MDRIVVKESESGFGRQFSIEWDGTCVIIDGVRCTPEVLIAIFVDPKPNVWLKFERKDDTVNVTQHTFVEGQRDKLELA